MAELANFLGYQSAALESSLFSIIPAPSEEDRKSTRLNSSHRCFTM